MTALTPRGSLSRKLLSALVSGPGPADGLLSTATEAVGCSDRLLDDEDVQLSLYLLYELHYGGLEGVDDRWEWSPVLLAVRAVLEDAFAQELRAEYGQDAESPRPDDVPGVLFELATAMSGPPGAGVAAYVARSATLDQVRELLALRSVYQLKEADPHTWCIPRLTGRAKAALVEIQQDEYGNGRFERMHSELFARCLRSVGMSDVPNAYLDHVPATSLSSVNAMSMFGLHRRWRGASCGLLAAVEMTSSLPCRRYVTGLERLGLGVDSTEFFDEHVEADSVHEQLAAHDLCGNLVRQEPSLVQDVLFGARVWHGLDDRIGSRILSAWLDGRSALLRPLPDDRVDSGSGGLPDAAA